MGLIYANRVVGNTWDYSKVPKSYKAATDAALAEKVEQGVITQEELDELKKL